MAKIDDIDPVAGKSIKDKIRNDLNPGSSSSGGLKHNKGRPKEAPYASTHGQDPRDAAATFVTNCALENRASLECIERNYQNRSACNEFFQAYKECRKAENEQRRNANSGGNDGGGGWFW